MILNLTILLALASIHVAAVMTPGANFLVVTQNALAYSRRRGLLTVVGVASGSTVYVTAGIIGFAALISHSTLVYNVIRFVGAAYFLWMGYRLLTRRPSLAAETSFTASGSDLSRAQAYRSGLAPPFPNAAALFEAAVEAIRTAGLRPGEDMALTLGVAASHFYEEGRYHLGAETLDGPAMVDRLMTWLDRYPLVSLEDGLAEEDWQGWQLLYERASHRALIVGDDLLCTNPARIRKAVELRAANTLLLKVNQIGTLTEAADACALAKSAGWKVLVSARSGETEDDWLADLAVGWGADHLKVGSITQSERLAKYNRLLAIERTTGLALA
jgi:hypothetical protein